ncbi:hypothetical protein L1987_59904 [Smallanthus sonchifolius]|uniref:Uncharacterized protein n=1 Tax=Smallanthus sonchifolius TaxID=185202 RepID=A0ACB9D6K1_9ASTR|nr:hypothetical protein L1987_59904 [Smallanthus sonchifolius]
MTKRSGGDMILLQKAFVRKTGKKGILHAISHLSPRVERGEFNIFYSKTHKSSTLCMQFRFSPGALHL